MEFIGDLLGSQPHWGWFALAVALLMIEIVTPTTYFFWPAGAAALVGVLAALVPGLELWVQVGVFSAFTIILAWTAPRLFPRTATGASDAPQLNRRAEQYVGRAVTVIEDFKNGLGRVQVDDTRWLARAADGDDYRKGDSVEILSVDSTRLTVRKP